MKLVFSLLNWLGNHGIEFQIVDCQDGEGNVIIETSKFNFITDEEGHKVYRMVGDAEFEPFEMIDINFYKWNEIEG